MVFRTRVFAIAAFTLAAAGFALGAIVAREARPAAATFPTATPGPRIVLRSGVGDIFTMLADGSDRQQLTDNEAEDRFPKWSPNGGKILFVSERAGNADLYVMNADGSAEEPLTTTAEAESQASWSPDGTKIAFSREISEGEHRIFVMNANGTGAVQVSQVESTSPDWSPDGTKLVFSAYPDATTAQVVVMAAAGGALTPLTSDENTNLEPVWSPDGTKIAWAAEGDIRDIWVMNGDGSNKLRLTEDLEYAGYPAWSPNGAHILFESRRDGDGEIYRMKADGSEETNLTNMPDLFDFDADWLWGGTSPGPGPAPMPPPAPIPPPAPLLPRRAVIASVTRD